MMSIHELADYRINYPKTEIPDNTRKQPLETNPIFGGKRHEAVIQRGYSELLLYGISSLSTISDLGAINLFAIHPCFNNFNVFDNIRIHFSWVIIKNHEVG